MTSVQTLSLARREAIGFGVNDGDQEDVARVIA
jgi:hypothetical protein